MEEQIRRFRRRTTQIGVIVMLITLSLLGFGYTEHVLTHGGIALAIACALIVVLTNVMESVGDFDSPQDNDDGPP